MSKLDSYNVLLMEKFRRTCWYLYQYIGFKFWSTLIICCNTRVHLFLLFFTKLCYKANSYVTRFQNSPLLYTFSPGINQNTCCTCLHYKEHVRFKNTLHWPLYSGSCNLRPPPHTHTHTHTHFSILTFLYFKTPGLRLPIHAICDTTYFFEITVPQF